MQRGQVAIMLIRRMFSPLAALALLLAGCGSPPEPPPPASPLEVAVRTPQPLQITDYIESTGHLAPLEFVEVRARVTGFMREIHVQPRAIVDKGQLLFTIDPRPFQAVLDRALGELAARRAELGRAQFLVDKVERLRREGAYSEEEYVTNVANRDALLAAIAQSQAAVDEAQLDLSFCSVQAPIHGHISRNLVDVGNIVKADTTVLANITNDAEVYLYANASEREVLVVREQLRRAGDPDVDPTQSHVLHIPVFMGLMTDEGCPRAGFIDYAAPSMDAATGTIEARARFPNADGLLIPGLFARIRVPIGDPYNALTVPEHALGFDQGQRFVLIVNQNNVVERRRVTLGPLRDKNRVIKTGLQPTDRVIVGGAIRVRPGTTVVPHVDPETGSADAPILPSTTP